MARIPSDGRRHDIARHRGRAERRWYLPTGSTAGQRRERRDGRGVTASSRRSRARISRSSDGVAWSRPQMWSAPWVTRSRISSAGRPADIAGLAAATLSGLLDRALDRHDDVAEIDTTSGWPRDGGHGGSRGERRGWQQREGQDVRRSHVTHVLEVQRGQLRIVSEDQAYRRWRRSIDRIERHRDGARQTGRRCRGADAIAHVDVDPPRSVVDRPGHETGRSPPAPADPPAALARRDSSSTTVFWG